MNGIQIKLYFISVSHKIHDNIVKMETTKKYGYFDRHKKIKIYTYFFSSNLLNHFYTGTKQIILVFSTKIYEKLVLIMLFI